MKELSGLLRMVSVLLVMAGLNGGLSAANVTFAWRANPEPALAGYNLYHGTAPGTYSGHIVLGLVTNYTMTNLVSGTTYYFALSAFDTNDLESDLTPELQFPGSPTLANIANQSTPEDTGLTVNLTVSDPDTPVANLTLSATSTNLTLLPNGNITFSGNTSNRTMTITPAANQSGTTRITVTVSDGERTASRNFILTVNGAADGPTISPIADVITDEDVQTGAVAFTIGDTDTPVANLTLRATSSNTSLIPTNRITLAGTGTSRTVTLRPTTNQSGSASITLTVSDGTLSSSTTFNFTVRAVNDAPTITAISDVTRPEDTATGAIAFTINDLETGAAGLQVTGSSSNPGIVPQQNISLNGGTGTNRTVTVNPATNAVGSAVITITVSDGQASASESFTVTFTGVNDEGPTIAGIADVTTDEDVQTGAITFTIGDTDTPVANLTLRATSSNPTLIPTNRITLAGTGTSRTVTLRPMTNQSGSASITLTVSDGVLSSSTTFNFTVRAVNDAPTIAAINDVTVAEDTATSAIAFTINDVDTAIAGLQVTRTSSNPAIVPQQNVYLNGGTGTNRTVLVTPVTNAVGNSVITITVSDGQASASEAFTVTFTGVNDAPIVSQPADIVVNKFNPVPQVNFTVWDPEGTPVSISFGSTNQTLLPLTNIVMSGTGTNRTLTLTPIGIGMTRIAINANDGAATNRIFFCLTVTGSNNPPVLTVPSGLAGNAGAPIDLRGISVTDPDLKTNNMNFTINAPNGSVTVSTSVANGVRAAQVAGNNSGAVTIVAPMAALNATFAAVNGLSYRSRTDFTGTETLVVTANDNGFTGLGGIKTDTENLLVQVGGSASTGIQAWRAANFSSADLQDPTKEATVWGDLADPDNDGRQNLMEYALGLNPLGSEPQDAALLSQIINNGNDQQQTLTFNARANDSSLQYIAEVSSDNAAWSATAVLMANTPVTADFNRVTYRDPVVVTSAAARFIRLRVVSTNPVQVVSESFVGSAATLAGVQGTATERTSFLSSRAVRPAVYAGKVTATAATSITDANANWTSAEFGSRGALYAEFANGVEADIQQVSYGPKRLTFSGALPPSITPGLAYRIREHHTIGSIFGPGNEAGLLPGASGAAAEAIFHFDSETQQRRTYYYLSFNGASGWVQQDYSPASNTVIYPEQGLMVRRLTPEDITISSSGPLKQAPVTIYISPGNNLLGLYNRATPIRLDALNLPAAGFAGATGPDVADLIRKINPNGLTTTYFYLNLTGYEGWYDTGYQPAGHVTLSPGDVFVLYRRAAPALEWTLPAQ